MYTIYIICPDHVSRKNWVNCIDFVSNVDCIQIKEKERHILRLVARLLTYTPSLIIALFMVNIQHDTIGLNIFKTLLSWRQAFCDAYCSNTIFHTESRLHCLLPESTDILWHAYFDAKGVVTHEKLRCRYYKEDTEHLPPFRGQWSKICLTGLPSQYLANLSLIWWMSVHSIV